MLNLSAEVDAGDLAMSDSQEALLNKAMALWLNRALGQAWNKWREVYGDRPEFDLEKGGHLTLFTKVVYEFLVFQC